MPEPVLPTPSLPPAAQPVADWAPLVERMRPALWRYARVLGADANTADDLVQEAFVTALRRPDFDARRPAAVFTFLRTTCRHLWLRSRVRMVSERQVEEADLVWTTRCGDGPGDDYAEALRACLERLPAKSSALLAATYGDGAGRDAAGATFGLSRDGVKSALRRLRTFLHDCIRRRLEPTR